MKRLQYRPSKISTIGFVLVASAAFLFFIEVASPDARAELSEPTKQSTAKDAASSINKAVRNITTKHKELSSPDVKQSKISYSQRLKSTNPNDQTDTKDDKKVQPTAIPASKTAQSTIAPKESDEQSNKSYESTSRDNRRSDCEVDCTIKARTNTSARSYDDSRQTTYKPTPTPVQKRTQHTTYQHQEYPSKTVTYHDTPKPQPTIRKSKVYDRHVEVEKSEQVKADTHRHRTTEHTRATQRPAKEVHHTVVVQKEKEYVEQPVYEYVAAERYEKVETPRELPSTGPGLATIVSLGGVISALLARKLFGF